MSTTITFLGHGAFQIQTAGKTILIDPFLTGNPLASVSADSVQPDYIVVSHGHGDHVGDTVAIARRTNCLVITNYEIATWLKEQGVERTHDMNTGGSYKFDFGTIKLTMAHHGSMLPDGSYGGCATGVLLKTSDGRWFSASGICHPGTLQHVSRDRAGCGGMVITSQVRHVCQTCRAESWAVVYVVSS